MEGGVGIEPHILPVVRPGVLAKAPSARIAATIGGGYGPKRLEFTGFQHRQHSTLSAKCSQLCKW